MTKTPVKTNSPHAGQAEAELPDTAIFIPPLIVSLAGLLRLRGKTVSTGMLAAGLPGGFACPTTEDCMHAARLAGLNPSVVEVEQVKSIEPATLPCILILKNSEEMPEASLLAGEVSHTSVSSFIKGTLSAGSSRPPLGEPADPKSSVLPTESLNLPKNLQNQKNANPPFPGAINSCILTAVDADQKTASVILPGEEPHTTTLDLAELESRFTGQAVFLPRELPKADSRMDNLHLVPEQHWFWGTLREFFPIYRDVALASLLVNLLSLAGPLFIMNVYDRVVPNNAIHSLWVLVIGLMFAHFMDFVLRNIRSRYVDTAGRNADVIITSMLMDRVLHMRLDSKPESTGGLVNNLREVEQVRDFFGSTTLLALFDLPFLLLFVILVAFIGGPMVTLVLAALPLMLGFIWLVQRPFQRSVERHLKQNIHKNSLLVEIAGGLETIKSILAQGSMTRRWEEVVDAAAKESAHARRMASLAQSGSLFITYAINAGVIVTGVYQIARGNMTQGGLIACVILVGRALGPFMQLAAMLTQMHKARIALRALDTIVHLPQEKRGVEVSDSLGLRPDYLLSHVSFRYPGSAGTALRQVSLQIRAGERIGVIGSAGSGKSTLSRLLVGLFDPEDGNIAFGGVDIRQMDPSALRSRVGYMPQDNYLFYGSVRENIALGMPWIDMKTVAQAAKLAGVTEFVNKHPQGFDMPVGERGMALSGGQRQAVALARTLVRNPDVLILDEPSSNMDMAGEYRLMLRLKSILGHKTLIVMTHRSSLLSLVDRVIVMHDGMVLADGPRDAILQAVREGKIQAAGERHG